MVQQATAPPIVLDAWVPMSYEKWLEWAPHNIFSEWVDGKGIVFVPSNEEHQRVALLFYELLSRYARLFDLGNVITAPYHVKLWERGPARTRCHLCRQSGSPPLDTDAGVRRGDARA
jgi:hypothetical protein